ncbi:MAG: hypothetical protein LBT05_15165 [Planctomycetaceae bacterium]|nr:hypothetical protein [Planctomycetaceae bacterium]
MTRFFILIYPVNHVDPVEKIYLLDGYRKVTVDEVYDAISKTKYPFDIPSKEKRK